MNDYDFYRALQRTAAEKRAARRIAARKAARTRRLRGTQYRPEHCPYCGAFMSAGCRNPTCSQTSDTVVD